MITQRIGPVEAVCRRYGISYRQLDYWERLGLFEVEFQGISEEVIIPIRVARYQSPYVKRGHRRVFSPEAIARIGVIAGLRNLGFELPKIRKLLASEKIEREIRRYARAVDSVADRYRLDLKEASTSD